MSRSRRDGRSRGGGTPRSAEWGHASAAAWGLLWLLAALLHRSAGWAIVIGLVGVVILALVAFAARRSPRAWLLVQLFTTIVLLCGVASLFTTDGGSPDVRPFIVVTAALQAFSVTALNQRASRIWHRVDPEGWRTVFQ